jgi:outer membrane lipoprotein-sorting protein
MKKISFLIFNLFILSGCVQSTAMLGPALTAASTGNALQTGFSYGANLTIKKTTGKNPSEHIVDYKAKKKLEKNLKNLLKKHIKLTRKKILLRTKN